MESCNSPMAINMKATGGRMKFLVMILAMSLRTVIGIPDKPCLDSLRAWVHSTSEKKVSTKDNS